MKPMQQKYLFSGSLKNATLVGRAFMPDKTPEGNNMKKILLISALLLTSAHIQAADSCDTGNVYTDLECHQQRTAQIKPKLNAAYAELQKYSSFGAAKAFEQSQKLWLQWVEKDCQFENTPSSVA